jgi:uncharacterized protein
VETGITIQPQELQSIDRIESMIRQMFSCLVVRCRLRANGVEIEVDESSLPKLRSAGEVLKQQIKEFLSGRFAGSPISFSAYKMGSAFLRESNEIIS